MRARSSLRAVFGGAGILAAILAAAPGRARAQAPEVEVDDRLPFATRRVIDIVLDEPGVTIETGETIVAPGDTIAGPLVQLGERLRIAGTVMGDVTAVDADVVLESGASVRGRVVALGGTVRAAAGASVTGRTVELPEERVAVIEQPAGGVRVAFVPPQVEAPFPFHLGGIFGFVLREYNGVDGLTFGIQARLRDLPNHPLTELAGGPLFRTERMEEVGWAIDGLREVPRLGGIVVGGRFYSMTDTNQRWHRPDFTNSVAAFLFANDDRAYHEREGYELSVERAWILTPVTLRARWRDDDFDSLPGESPFALFAGDADWPANPFVKPGGGRALGVAVTWDRRNAKALATRGAYAEARYDRWGFGGDFEFDWGQVDLRGYLPIGAESFASLRVVAGGRLGGGDTLAPQFLYRLGGARTIVGYDPLSESLVGDRAVLANLRIHRSLPFSNRYFRTLYLVGLADAGDAWFPAESADWVAGLGAGIAGRGQTAYLGVFAAYGLDSEEWHAYLVVGPWF